MPDLFRLAGDFDRSIDDVWAMLHDPDAHVAKFTRMGHTDLEVLSVHVGLLRAKPKYRAWVKLSARSCWMIS